MKRRVLMAFGLGASMAMAGCGEGQALDDSGAEDAPVVTAAAARGAIPGRYIVVLRPGMATQARFAIEQNLVRTLGGQVLHSYTEALSGFAATLTEAAAQRLRGEAAVELVEPDQVVTLAATQQSPPWGLDRIDQRDLPLDRAYSYQAGGRGVDAYVIDTGIRTSHVDFGGRARPGFTAIQDGRDSRDCNGHGTHVAGTVGGRSYGVAKEVTLHAVRVLGCSGSGSTSGVIAGVDWVTSQHRQKGGGRPAVANMSLGGGASAALDQAIQRSIAAGVTYVVAAGNEAQNACNGSPARVRGAITVGASTSVDGRAGYSNYGPCVDLFAPGSGVRSAWPSSDAGSAALSGTSMAAPHVAGAVALYLESHPQATPAEVDAALRAAATPGKIRGAGPGSPNLLLGTSFQK